MPCTVLRTYKYMSHYLVQFVHSELYIYFIRSLLHFRMYRGISHVPVNLAICMSICVHTRTITTCLLSSQNDWVRIREWNIPAGRDTRNCHIQQPGEREPCRSHVDNRCCAARGRNCVPQVARDVLRATVGATPVNIIDWDPLSLELHLTVWEKALKLSVHRAD